MGPTGRKEEEGTRREAQIVFPPSYKPILGFIDTQRAIAMTKMLFEMKLTDALSLVKIESPRFILTGTGIQDDLAGTQAPVEVDLASRPGQVEIVHSLAKWKRSMLARPEFEVSTGVLALMDAIRKEETTSPIHSHFVDQWDWECILAREDRTLDFLKLYVSKIYQCLRETSYAVHDEFPQLKLDMPEEITFVHSEDLETAFPLLSPSERETAIVKRHGAVFLIGIGYPLHSGKPHDLRAADYDDWCTATSPRTHGLNGDILLWDGIRKASIEISSMGIRVDEKALSKQLDISGERCKEKMPFHKAVLDGKLPLTIGGGIGRSRVCMLLLNKAHIGEVQSSVWSEHTEREFSRLDIPLL